MFAFLRRRRATPPTPVMAEADRKIIRRFAAGDISLRAQAIGIHRRYNSVLGVRGTPEQDFMAEIDTAQPDMGLRVTYRDRLLRSDAF